MQKRRTQLEIMRDILELCKVPRKKTHVVYLCNLNFKIYKKYVESLMDADYLIYDGTYFFTTSKGYQRLDEFSPVLMHFEEVRLYPSNR